MTCLPNTPKIESLARVYEYYDRIVKHQAMVCQKGCASCCTCNVTMTSLEAAYVSHLLNAEEKTALKENIKNNFPEKRYIPLITTNHFVRLCMEGKNVAEAENDPAWGRCPALQSNACSIYTARPFGCRVLMSTVSCELNGYAQVSPEIIATNTVFMQTIEHLDQNGISGNFSDILPLYLNEVLPAECHRPADMQSIQGEKGLLFSANEKIAVLMIEPEHRKKLAPVVQTLSSFF